EGIVIIARFAARRTPSPEKIGDALRHLEQARAMPVGNALRRIRGEVRMPRTAGDLHPRHSEVEHYFDFIHRLGQGRIDRRGERVDPLGPLRIPRPERAAALLAEVPPRCRELLALALAEARTVHAHVLLALELER